ncbi:hypothetical protein UK23_32360 [Lentzea aerocolonigenes]|uniref:Carrier domain-containing protein n=1 Tax=Lentzea aerocolonigenes TaxID=68170 RepID=A0A0F0GP02_LENAE|nr:hypothetical protein UK23_32360 [Lentzea aerocolonigenes]
MIARTAPGRTAVRAGGRTLTYGELIAWADTIAARLVAAGAGPGHRVGVLVAPSAAMVAAALGVLRAGAAYVPVDHGQPARRVREVLADARVTGVLTDIPDDERLAGFPAFPVTESARPQAFTAPPAAQGDPAYLIYTSGSTGEPKGVLVEHGQLTASTLARHQVYPGRPTFLLLSPLAFDSSVAGIWGTLTAGGTLVVATADEVRDPARLAELVREHGVTQLLCVPSLYAVLLDAARRTGGLDSLDTVVVAGESLPESLLRRHFSAHAQPVALVNEYGPTEATVWATYRWYDREGPVSIGGPVPGTVLHLLDDDLRPVPQGQEGELVVGGPGVARGYFGRPEATAAVFVDDPFTGGRMYRTGDRARWARDGTLEFLGRRDHQVKVRGHRIELGAVESALHDLPGVRDAAVVPNQAHTQLLGFVRADATVTGSWLRDQLAIRLPQAMVPVRIDVLDQLPRTFAGKVDRVRLRELADGAPADVPDGSGTAPPTGTATSVAAAWAEVLKMPDVPVDANFFDIGGHSLAMFELQEALERHTGTRPSVVALFRHTTVTAQTELISGSGAGQDHADYRQDARRRALQARRQRTTRETA